MSDFAKAQMQKYGWREGKGLGKNEDGITKPVRAMYKFNTAGMGYKETVANSSMEDNYNSVIKNIQVGSHSDNVFVPISKDTQDIVPSEKSEKAQEKNGHSFKTSILHRDVFIDDDAIRRRINSVILTCSPLSPVVAMALRKARSDADNIIEPPFGSTSIGKLNRIALQDTMLLTDKNNITSQSNTNSAKESIITHKNINIESRVEKNEYKTDIDTNASSSIWTPKFQDKKRALHDLLRQLVIDNMKEEANKAEHSCLYNNRLHCIGKRRKAREVTKMSMGNSIDDEAKNEFYQSAIPHKYHTTVMSLKKESKTEKPEECESCQKEDPGISNKAKDSNDFLIKIKLDDINLPQPETFKTLYGKINEKSDVMVNQTSRNLNQGMCKPMYLMGRSIRKRNFGFRQMVNECKPSKGFNSLDDLNRHKLIVDKLNHNIHKRKERKKKRNTQKRMEDAVQNLKHKIDGKNINDLVNGLTAVNLTNATIKKKPIKTKPTQTHHTPV